MRGLTRMSLPPFLPGQQSMPPPQPQVQPPRASCDPPDSPAHTAQNCTATGSEVRPPAPCAMILGFLHGQVSCTRQHRSNTVVGLLLLHLSPKRQMQRVTWGSEQSPALVPRGCQAAG